LPGTSRKAQRNGAELAARRPTINDIARLANVSKKTVSRVINNSPFVRADTREKVAAVMSETGYAPDPQARGLAFRRSFLIALIADQAPNIVGIQQGILGALRDTDFGLMVRLYERGDRATLDSVGAFVARQRPWGVILPQTLSGDAELRQLLDGHRCRAITITASSPHGAREQARAAATQLMAAEPDAVVSSHRARLRKR
jgi:LacI family transcriptional regulator